MKKTFILVLSIITLLGSITATHAEVRFSDVKANDWFSSSVTKLTSLGGIAGYPDGTFRPYGTVTRAECIALVVQALNIKTKATHTDPWYAGIMAAAEECGLIDATEFTDASKPITRYEMARLAVHALAYKKEEIPSDYADYASLVFDLNKSAAYREDINKVIATGILNGYTDRTFQGLRTLTRAEAASVVVRIMDKDARKVPVKPSPEGEIALGETKTANEFISNLSVLSKTNPYLKTVTLTDNDTLKMTLSTGSSGERYLHVPGKVGLITAIKDGRSEATFPGVFMAPDYTYFSEEKLKGDIESFDYFGFYSYPSGMDSGNITLISNPWNE